MEAGSQFVSCSWLAVDSGSYFCRYEQCRTSPILQHTDLGRSHRPPDCIYCELANCGSDTQQTNAKEYFLVSGCNLGRGDHAVNNVSLSADRGEALCIVGESGCGKSTVARLVAGLLAPSGGEIHYDGERIDDRSRGEMMPLRKKMQMIFQNPYASLNPRMTIQQALEEPVRHHNPSLSRGEVRDKVSEVMRSVGVDPSWSSRYPHE